MNETNIACSSASLLLRIDSLAVSHLRKPWNRALLRGGIWRLYVNDRGGAGVRIGGRKRELQPGFVYVLPPHCDLETWAEGDPEQLYIHFELSNYAGRAESPMNALALDPELARCESETRRLLRGNHTAQALLPALALLAGSLTRLPPDAFEPLGIDGRIERICSLIRNAPEHDWSVAELARKTHFAANSFIRRFREVTGESPYRYLHNVRYTHAERLLRESAFSIEEICEKIGVHDRFHFTRTFKSLFGMPPAAYRAAYRK